MAKTMTMYICDGKFCGRNALYCKARKHKNWLCQHTTNINNAKNGPCDDPWRHPERFTKEIENKRIYYIEKENKN